MLGQRQWFGDWGCERVGISAKRHKTLGSVSPSISQGYFAKERRGYFNKSWLILSCAIPVLMTFYSSAFFFNVLNKSFKGEISSIKSIYNLLKEVIVPSMDATVNAESPPCLSCTPELDSNLSHSMPQQDEVSAYVWSIWDHSYKSPQGQICDTHCAWATGIFKIFKSNGLIIRIMLIYIWDI